MKTIIVAVDFSPVSETAAYFAADLALEIHANLVLFNAYQYPLTTGEVTLPPQVFQEIIEGAQEAMESLERKINKHLGGKQIATTEIREGSVISHLADYCKDHPTDLVVMGSSGVSAGGRFFLGSQALSAIKRLPVPVLIVPPKTKFAGMNAIGLATDLVEVETSLPVQSIRNIVRALHGKLFLGYVTNWYDYDPSINSEIAKTERLFGSDDVHVRIIQDEDVEDGIHKFCRMDKLDLLILVPHRHAFFERLLHSTHTAKLLAEPIVPMLFLRK